MVWVVKHVIIIANSHPLWWRQFHTLGLSSTTPRNPHGGVRGSQWVSVSWFGLRGHSLGAVPQSRLSSLPGIHCRHLGQLRHVTPLTWRGNSLAWELGSSREAASTRSYGAGQRMGNNYLVHMRRCNSPIWVMWKYQHKCILGAHNRVKRHTLYPRHHSWAFVIPKNARNAESKYQAKAVPILLLARCFDNLHLLLQWCSAGFQTLDISYLKCRSNHSATLAWCVIVCAHGCERNTACLKSIF